jgi:putative SOS response-associated peptidase YedK
MCGRYVTVTETKLIEKKFNVEKSPEFDFQPNFNIAAGDRAPIITSAEPKLLQTFTFGFTPSWSKKKTYVINARSEGDHNKENKPDYQGAKGIIKKPFFRSSIRSKRCLVIADAFIEGTTREKLNNPFAVYLINKQRPFAFAGIYDEWVDQETGEILNSFAIITTAPNKLMQMIPHHRMPVILNPSDYGNYLSEDAPLESITSMLYPYDHKQMNAYPIENSIKNPRSNGSSLIEPIGAPLQKEYYYRQEQKTILLGMGMSPSRYRKLEEEGKLEESDSTKDQNNSPQTTLDF